MPVDRDEVIEWIKACWKELAENRDYLIRLDAAIGDADHGANKVGPSEFSNRSLIYTRLKFTKEK